MTIHITPEEKFSHVSFESNVAIKNYSELINKVLNCFIPSKFIVTIFANMVRFNNFVNSMNCLKKNNLLSCIKIYIYFFFVYSINLKNSQSRKV